jgi:hypothetical protein
MPLRGAAGRHQRPASALRRPGLARAGPHTPSARRLSVGSPGDAPGAARCRLPRRSIVPLPAAASRSLPCGPSLRDWLSPPLDPPVTRTERGACEQPMREMSNAGLRGARMWVSGPVACASPGCVHDVGCLVAGRGWPRCRPALDLTLNRVCPNSPHPSLCRAGGGRPGSQTGSAHGKRPGSAPRPRSPGWHQAAGTTTVVSAGAAAPEAIAASQGMRRVTTTNSWRSSAAASAAWAWPLVSRLRSRVVSWPCRVA